MTIDPPLHGSVELLAPIPTAWSMRSGVSKARPLRHRDQLRSIGRFGGSDSATMAA